jgi:type I restriction enzyme M protein
MAIKKSELYSSIWEGCDQLRGGMDASQYKDYVLVLLFVKYVSDKYVGQPDALIEVPKGGSFSDLMALKGDKDIGDKTNKIITKLAEANGLKGVIDVADFNDVDKLGKGQAMVDRLSKLISIFAKPDLDFSRNRAEGDDLLGDAYEYLMRNFATQSGKSKGQFYTPAEVSRVIAKVIGINKATSQSQTIYDPTCGSGSLLLKAADESKRGITIYGQEMDNATAALAKMNMILHNHPTAEIWQDNTLSHPHYLERNGTLKLHDFAVANPPFSSKAWSNGFNPDEDHYGRFSDGIPPDKNGDYAFLLHLLGSLKSKGKGAIILPHGVLFRGNAEGEIRRNLILRGVIKGIIGLPANLFFGTGIPACIIVLDKENAAGRRGIFIIDASKGFEKDGNKNRLRHQDVHKIVDVFNRQLELPKYSRMVNLTEIENNGYNLNIPRYIDSSEPEDMQDLTAHMTGGIPDADIDALADYWQVFPTLRRELFEPGAIHGYSRMKVETSVIKPTIFVHDEFTAYTEAVKALFGKWREAHTLRLKNIAVGSRPKALIEGLSEAILEAFAEAQLIDPYDVYQHLMTYWTETMQDDVYMIVVDGWQALVDGEPNYDLIPQSLVIDRYFAAERDEIEELKTTHDHISRQMEEMEEEHGGEDGLLSEARDKKGKLTKVSVNARLKEAEEDLDTYDERRVLEAYAVLIDEEAAAGKKVREALLALHSKVVAQYGKLSVKEIKSLVVDDKWLTAIAAGVQTELDRVSQALTGRIKTLAERYASPMPRLAEKVETLSALVDEHLKKMGVAWN